MGASCVHVEVPDFLSHVYTNWYILQWRQGMHASVGDCSTPSPVHPPLRFQQGVARDWRASVSRVRIRARAQRCLSEWPADAGLPEVWAYFIDLMVTALTTIAMYILSLEYRL
jgi:hypothetical protein